LPVSRARRNFLRAGFIRAKAEEVEAADSAAPLATRMRPRSLDEFVGQETHSWAGQTFAFAPLKPIVCRR